MSFKKFFVVSSLSKYGSYSTNAIFFFNVSWIQMNSINGFYQ